MNLAVLGAQWGDEGKGKIVDLLTPQFEIVARYQGGHNAGHTVYVAGKKFILRLIPSGILHPGVICVIGNGVVVDPQALLAEVDELVANGIDVSGRIVISDKAHLILPYHRDLDLLSEARRGERKIGTTSRGIGPAYEDKMARRGIRAGDLADPQALERGIRENVNARNRLVGDTAMDWRAVLDQLLTYGERIRPWVRDVSLMLSEAMQQGRAILFEGAQGTLLDIDHGTYPYVTSSNASIGGVLHRAWRGTANDRRRAGRRQGVHDARRRRTAADRVDRRDGQSAARERSRIRRRDGPSAPLRLVRRGRDSLQRPDQRSRCAGADEAGRAGRPRRSRHLHVVPMRRSDAHRFAVRHRRACRSASRSTSRCRAGRSRPKGARRLVDLPDAARRYVARLEEVSGVPAAIISTGSDRTDTILRHDVIAACRLPSFQDA